MKKNLSKALALALSTMLIAGGLTACSGGGTDAENPGGAAASGEAGAEGGEAAVDESEMTAEQVREHIDFMQHRERLYELFEGKNKFQYPNGSRYDQSGMVFVNELGMFAIKKRSDGKFKKYHEVIRYDEVAAYKPYEEKTTDSEGKEKFKEAGVVLKLADAGGYTEEMQKRGLRKHPFNYHDIKICIVKKEE